MPSMEQSRESLFERVVEALLEADYAVIDDFLPRAASVSLLQKLVQLHEKGEFQRAGIGRSGEFHRNAEIRGDEILWLEKQEFDDEIMVFIDQIESLIEYCNRSCYTGLRDYEAHFAVYPPGAYYRRHLDQFKGNDHRKFTFIFYLNFDWLPQDGGNLRMYIPDAEGELTVDIEPIGGRFVCFRSAKIPHEVLMTNATRYSITGWWLDQEKTLTFL